MWWKKLFRRARYAFADIKCPFCGALPDPVLEHKATYKCSDCARRWFKPGFGAPRTYKESEHMRAMKGKK